MFGLDWIKKLWHKWMVEDTDKAIIQLFRYFFVAGLATVVDYGIMVLLKEAVGFHYLVAASISFIAGLLTNFFLSINWIFKTNQNRFKEFISYGVIGIFGLILNNLIMALFTEVFGWFYVLSKLIASMVTFFFNFICRKVLLYRKKGKANNSAVIQEQ